MHLAVLITNTDDSDFAARHPNDAEKFRSLIQTRRPDWTISSFALPFGIYPANLSDFDGYIIGGSPASVHDQAEWIDWLMQAIPEIVALNRPLFGACFGHQAIARALGGTVGHNPNGWAFGVTRTEVQTPAPWMTEPPGRLRLNAAHSEQVTGLPTGAELIGGNADCPVGFYRFGTGVFATQYHPEFTDAFAAALVAHYAADLPAAVAARARESLAGPADTERMAGWIIGFFEQAGDGQAHHGKH